MTDGVDAPAVTEADAAVAASGQYLVPVRAPRGYHVLMAVLAHRRAGPGGFSPGDGG